MSLNAFVVSIVSQARCASAPLALAVDCKNLSGSLIASAFDPTQPSQLWLPMSVAESVAFSGFSFNVRAIAFINVLTGQALYSQGRDGSPALQVPFAQIGPQSMWGYGGAEAGNIAIRLGNDEDQNLRINGSAPFTSGMPVTTDGWAGGQPNEVWNCIQTSAPYPSAFDHIPYSLLLCTINADAGLNLSSTGASGDTSQLTVQTPDSNNTAQQFYVPVTVDATSGIFSGGVALINLASGNAACASGDGDNAQVYQVAVSLLDGYSTWILLSRQVQANQYAISPLVDDGQNLNIPGDGPYSAGQGVITYGWGGGASNEVWALNPVSSQARSIVFGGALWQSASSKP